MSDTQKAATPKTLAAQKRQQTLVKRKEKEESEQRLSAVAQVLPDEWAPTAEDKVALVKSAYSDILGVDKQGKGRPFTDLRYFLFQAAQRKLNPFKKQIHAVYIWDGQKKADQMVVITGIDGFRAVAQRSQRPLYAGSNEPTFTWKDSDKTQLDTATVEVCAYNPVTGAREVIAVGVARYDEYVKLVDEYETEYGADGKPLYSNGKPVRRKTGRQVPNSTWAKMPSLMLAKCAEAIALRKGFPEDLGGLYVSEEVDHMTSVPEPDGTDDDDMREKIKQELARRNSAPEGEVVDERTES